MPQLYKEMSETLIEIQVSVFILHSLLEFRKAIPLYFYIFHIGSRVKEPKLV